MEGPSVATEAASAPAPVSVSEKAADFENYLFPEEEEQEDETTEESDSDAEEGDDLDLDDEGQEDEADEPEAPAIDPPASLNADEKKAFAAASPEAQQAWAASEIRRNQQVQEATTKAAERERAATMATEQAEAAADARRAAQLKAFADAFRPEMPDPQLAQRDPASYIAAKAQYDADVAQFQAIEQQIEALGKDAVGRLESVDVTARAADLMTVPKLADPATRDDYVKTSLELVQALGLDPTAFEQSAGSEDFKALEKVAEWKAGFDKYQKAMSRQMQKVRSGKGKNLRPNASPQQSRGVNPDQQWQRVKTARNKSDQADAMAGWLESSGHL